MFQTFLKAALSLGAALLIAVAPVQAEQPKKLYWEDLVPKADAISHPFGKLDADVLKDLEAIIWAEMQLKKGNIEKEGETYKLAMALKQELVAKKIDVDGLVREFDRIQRLIRQNEMAVVKDLNGKIVRMPGYALPLEMTKDGITEFLLVPYVGACIHVPPPPPNQLVYVKSSVPWPGNELWDAVWVTGELRAGLKDTDVAETGYQLAATEMEVYVW